jgi:AraC-like DNA-binding protein
MLASQLWYYASSVGQTRWQQGQEFGHPNPDFGHRHDEGFLLHFVLRGQLNHYVDRRVHTVGPNDAFLFDLKHPVRYRNDSKAPVHFYWVSLDGKDMPRVFAELNAEDEPLFRGLNRKRVLDTLRELCRTLASEPRGYEARASGLLSLLLAELFAVRSPQPTLVRTNQPVSSTSPPIRKTIHYIDRYHGNPLSLKELSQVSGLSFYHFSHAFQHETGYSPIQYLNHYRIEQAKTLLVATELPVLQVARTVGISNLEYFSKLFRQINGVGPREYRAKSRE